MIIDKRKILIIENQKKQFELISKKLEEYDTYPKSDDYELFMTWIRILLNKRYSLERRDECFSKLVNYISILKVELFVIDYKLAGSHDGLDGIWLAVRLKGETSFNYIPIIFLSRTPQNTKQVTEDVILIKNSPVAWIEKGYAGLSLLEDSYFKKYILDEIPILINKSELLAYREKLNALLTKNIFEDHIDFLKKLRESHTLSAVERELIDYLFKNIRTLSKYDINFLIKKIKK